jgi:3-hydroxyisobutyrate dehydrogenase
MSDSPAPTSVGFWGLGNMGGPMARRLLAAGIRVLGFDVSSAARERFAAAGGVVLDGPEPLGEVGALILMLPNSDIVEEVLLRGDVAGALRPGTPIIDMSSCEPLRTQALATALADRGLRLIDAPVSGGVSGAENGTLSIMAGGTESDVAAVAGLLRHLGTPTRVGPSGAGHALKALNNLLSATHLWVTSEAILVGERFGLDPEVMLSTINGSSGRSGSTQNKWPNFILPGAYDSGFGLQLMLKDMKIATGLARELGMPIPLGDAAVSQWSRAADGLPATADHTEIARFLEEESRSPTPGIRG